MSASGKDLRLRHLLHRKSGTCILFAASHGTSTATLFHELDETAGKVAAAIDGGADSVLISPPIARLCGDIFRERPHAGFVAKVSATAFQSCRRETAIWSVGAATIAGADGIGIMMQLVPENEEAVIRLVASYGEECERLGMPYVVEAELPGVDEKDISVTLANGVLTIKGDKQQSKEEKNESFYLAERSYGSFERSLRLPDSIDESKVDARFDKGVLKVTCAKKPEAIKAERRIEINKSS